MIIAGLINVHMHIVIIHYYRALGNGQCFLSIEPEYLEPNVFVSECLHVVFLFSYFIAYLKFLLLIQFVSGEWPMLFEHRARVPGAQRFVSECLHVVFLFSYFIVYLKFT